MVDSFAFLRYGAVMTAKLVTCPHCKGCGKIEVSLEVLALEATRGFTKSQVERLVSSLHPGTLGDFIFDNFNEVYKSAGRLPSHALVFVLFAKVPHEQILARMTNLFPGTVLNWCKSNT